jgi:hypothetical protein
LRGYAVSCIWKDVPLIPKGLTESLVQRLKERVKRELSEGVLSPIAPVIQQQLGIEPDEPQPLQPHRRPTTLAEKMFRIQEAGGNNVLLWMEYNGVYRHVEPYSYRYRDRDNPHEPLLFAWCHKDKGIEAFKLRKITDCVVTDRPFTPRWPVEFGSVV